MTIKDFGAIGDGISDDAEALQRALDSGKEIAIPEGVWKVGRTLHAPSGVQLRAHERAHIILADGAAKGPDDFLLTNVPGARHISITGGLWDGNNPGNRRPEGLFTRGYTGAVFQFKDMRDLRLQGLHVRDSEAYHVRLTMVSGFNIRDISFSTSVFRPNQDGIHLGGNCEDGEIHGISGLHPGATNDDLVALNADDALERTEVFGMSSGPIRRIRISGLRAESCHSFVRLLSVWSPIEDVSVQDVQGSCQVAAVNCDAARGCRVTLFDQAHPPWADGVGRLANISLKNFRVRKSQENDCALLRLETRMHNFIAEDIQHTEGGCTAPLLRVRLTQLLKWSLNAPGDVRTGSLAPTEELRCDAPRIDEFVVRG